VFKIIPFVKIQIARQCFKNCALRVIMWYRSRYIFLPSSTASLAQLPVNHDVSLNIRHLIFLKDFLLSNSCSFSSTNMLRSFEVRAKKFVAMNAVFESYLYCRL